MEEIAFLAYYLHWSRDELMNLPHWERQAWCKRVSAINKDITGSPDNIFEV